MATVTGFTAARMEEIEAASVVSGVVNGSGDLILERNDGSTFNAGTVIGPAGSPASALLTIDPTDTKVTLTLAGAGTPASPWILKAVLDTLVTTDIPDMDAAKIISGRFPADRLPYAFALSTSDLDTFIEPMEGYQGTSGNATLANHYPVASVVGFLKVFSRSGYTQIQQIYYPWTAIGASAGERFYIRHRNSGVWSAWREFVSDSARLSSQIDVYSTPGVAVWTKPAGAKRHKVYLVGGSSGGGGVIGAASGQGEGSAAGGAGYCEKWYDSSALGATESLTVGAAGAGVSGANGTAGTASVFKGMTASPGGVGLVLTSTATTGAATGAGGGAATGGDINIPGGQGGNGRVITGLAILAARGGDSHLGRGGLVGTSAGARAATGYGAGGSGAFATTTSVAGGNGSAGLVVVETYF